MTERIINIANRFLVEKDCTSQELLAFKKWLSDPEAHLEVGNWLSEHRISSSEIDSNTM